MGAPTEGTPKVIFASVLQTRAAAAVAHVLLLWMDKVRSHHPRNNGEPLLVGIYVGESNHSQGFLGGAKWISFIHSVGDPFQSTWELPFLQFIIILIIPS